jgi:hypothetical protein
MNSPTLAGHQSARPDNGSLPAVPHLLSHAESISLRHWATIGVVAYALVTTVLAGFRLEPWLCAGLCLSALALRRRVADLFNRLVPYLVFLTLYDALRYASAALLTPDRVAVCSIRSIEVVLFGFGSDTTPGEWLARLHSPVLDLMFAAPYFVFAFVVIAYALFLYRVDPVRMSRFLWAFALANVIAFAIWVVVPCAPPWYQHAHGCRADLAAPASPAGLLRVDALLHVDYFARFYGKSTYLFGAWPSLHCTYPMIGLLTAWRHTGWRTRPIHLIYVAWMFCASVYLDHHYLIDGLSGFVLAALSVYLVGRVSALRGSVRAGVTAERRSLSES